MVWWPARARPHQVWCRNALKVTRPLGSCRASGTSLRVKPRAPPSLLVLAGFRLVEKYALLVGGAATHRHDLSQMVMLKGELPDYGGTPSTPWRVTLDSVASATWMFLAGRR